MDKILRRCARQNPLLTSLRDCAPATNKFHEPRRPDTRLDRDDKSAVESSMSDPTVLENDLRAIKGLNQRHIEAVLASDIEAVMSEWSEDFTVLPPAGPIIRGRHNNVEIVLKGMSQIQAFEPLEYVE